jgi:chorismate synthase
MGNSFGQLFRITTWGESHGGAVGVVIDGCPPRIELNEEDIQRELDRRRPGQSTIVTPRDEADRCQILSGVFEGKTLGTPISIVVPNKDARPEAYAEMESTYRPSHADFTYEAKFGIRDWQGGGRASARETVGRVAAGAVARKVLAALFPGIELLAYVTHVHDVDAAIDPGAVTLKQIEANAVRCPDPVAAEKMIAAIEKARTEGDSLGGAIGCVARGVAAGLGAPVFDKLEADLAKAMLSLPASKGFEIGSGFAGTRMRGSEHNDPFEIRDGAVRTTSNRSGGIQGGISNGENILFRVAFKPTSTIAREQKTVTAKGEETTLAARGRHDPCVLPRAVPIVEAMAALVLCDHALRQRAIGLAISDVGMEPAGAGRLRRVAREGERAGATESKPETGS